MSEQRKKGITVLQKASPRCIRGNAILKLQKSSLLCDQKHVKEEKLCDWLWDETEAARQRALQTYFIQSIKIAQLDPTGFGGYMVQDSVYCMKVKEFLDIAAGRSKMSSLQEFLEEQSKSYESYYENLFAEWHIRDARGIDLNSACQEYVDTIGDVAHKDDPIYILIAELPCARLWPWLGQQLVKEPHDFGAYTDWIDENLNPKSEGYKEVELRVNAAYAQGKVNKNEALEIYSKCMNGEANFFGSVKNPDA